MIENYEVTQDGVIKQIIRHKFIYDSEYVLSRYESYGELTLRMSYLRLGYIFGSVGRMPKSVLDVGYGNGSFISLCNSLGIACYGHDVSDWPIPTGCTRIESIGDVKVECATFFDSLEHFPDIDIISSLQADFVVITVPWCHYESDEWFKSWKHRRPDEHLWHFDKDSLQRFMFRHGYELVSFCSLEDIIRKGPEVNNILTCTFRHKGAW